MITSPCLSPALSAGLPGTTPADHHAFGRLVEAELAGQCRRERLERDADPGIMDLAVLDQHVGDAGGQVDRNREADPVVAAAAGDDRRIDADHVAVHVDQRTARVAPVDRRIGLDERLVLVDADRIALEGRDDARRHALARTRTESRRP